MGMHVVRVLVSTSAERRVMLQIVDGDRMLAWVSVDPESARTIAQQIMNSADVAEGIPPKLMDLNLKGSST